jgi:hypothetical protein
LNTSNNELIKEKMTDFAVNSMALNQNLIINQKTFDLSKINISKVYKIRIERKDQNLIINKDFNNQTVDRNIDSVLGNY